MTEPTVPMSIDTLMVCAIEDIDLRRRVLNVTQADLCREADVSPHTYSRMVLGHCEPTFATLRKLSGALDQLAAAEPLGARRA
jgi:predicted transcriptional regulator